MRPFRIQRLDIISLRPYHRYCFRTHVNPEAGLSGANGECKRAHVVVATRPACPPWPSLSGSVGCRVRLRTGPGPATELQKIPNLRGAPLHQRRLRRAARLPAGHGLHGGGAHRVTGTVGAAETMVYEIGCNGPPVWNDNVSGLA
jgi:hypothetical protein